jgi:hypothetical protein
MRQAIFRDRMPERSDSRAFALSWLIDARRGGLVLRPKFDGSKIGIDPDPDSVSAADRPYRLSVAGPLAVQVRG